MPNPTKDPAPRPALGGADGPAPAGARPAAPRRRRSGRRPPTLAELTWNLAERRGTVLAVTVAAALAGLAFLAIAEPVYEASVLVQVEGRARPAGPEDVIQLFDTNPPAAAEMRILVSRGLVGAAVEELGLDLEARPRVPPVLGGALARHRAGGEPAAAPLGLTRYAWGGERIRVTRLEVPEALLGERLVLVAGPDGAYALRGPDGAVLVEGAVGTLATAGSGGEAVSVLVAELSARPETEFVLRKLRRDELVARLQRNLQVTEQGRPGGLVQVRLEGPSPELLSRFLEALAGAYVRQSLARTSAEAASMLRTVEGRLPGLKASLDDAERALTRFHRRNGPLNLSLDAQRLLLRAGELDRAVTEMELAEADRARRHSPRYPELAAPAERAERLRAQRVEVESQIAALPALELEAARLTRAVTVATDRHARVLARAEELRTATASWLGNAQVVEHAVEPRKPVSPRPGLVMALAILLGLGGGVALALLRGALDEGVRDPDELEDRTGLPVFAAVPRSDRQRRLGGRAPRLSALAIVDPGDGAVEELRALRTGVQFALARAANHVVTVGSPAPGAGKSFVTVNLAHLLAQPDGRVLVIDADLRRGVLHRYFDLDAQPGLSDFLAGDATLEVAVRRTGYPNVDLLPSGRRVGNPAELLSGEPLRRLLETLGGRYGVILVDTPPILSVTDCALVGRHAGVNLLVIRSGEQSPREIDLAVKRLVQNGIQVSGAVLNDVRPTLGRYGRAGRYRRYDTRPA